LKILRQEKEIKVRIKIFVSESIDLISDLIDFQKQVIHFKSSEKSMESIFSFLADHIQFQQAFVLYKLKEEDLQYDMYAADSTSKLQLQKFVNASNIELFKLLFKDAELSYLIADTSQFHPQEVDWATLRAKSAIIFPLKARGQLFGIGVLIKENAAFESK